VLPAEQPARTTATARSAAARARLGTGRCDRDINIMPVQAPAGLQRHRVDRILPFEAKLLPIQAIESKL
jgi:hypothetical protein